MEDGDDPVIIGRGGHFVRESRAKDAATVEVDARRDAQPHRHARAKEEVTRTCDTMKAR